MRSLTWVFFLTSVLVIGTSGHLDAKTSDPQAVVSFKAEVAEGKGKDWSVITVELRPGAVDSWHSRPGASLSTCSKAQDAWSYSPLDRHGLHRTTRHERIRRMGSRRSS